MWSLYNLAKQWATRPSEFIGIEGEWTAHDFDSAVHHFGRHVESRLDDVELTDDEREARNSREVMKRKLERELKILLDIEDPVVSYGRDDDPYAALAQALQSGGTGKVVRVPARKNPD